MFGVLVVVLRSDQIAGEGYSAGELEISLVVSLRILRSLRLVAGAF
jgi:hypothetical protein